MNRGEPVRETFKVDHRATDGRRKRDRPRSGPVTTSMVVETVWEGALQAADGDVALIKVISRTRVEIRDPRY